GMRSLVAIIKRLAGLILLDVSHKEPYGRLAVLMKGRCPANVVRAERRAKFARLSPRARQVIAEWSGHFIELDRADVLTAAVQEVAGAVAVSGPTGSGGPR